MCVSVAVPSERSYRQWVLLSRATDRTAEASGVVCQHETTEYVRI